MPNFCWIILEKVKIHFWSVVKVLLKLARNTNLESYLLAACCSLFSNVFFCLLLPVVTRFVCSSILYTFRRKLIEHKVNFFLVVQFSFSLWKGVVYFLQDPCNNNCQKHTLSSGSIYFDHKKGFQFEIKPNFYLAHWIQQLIPKI